MARGRIRTRTIQVFRGGGGRIRRGVRRVRSSRGFKFGGGLLQKTELALGRGTLYGGAASKFAPQFAPLATLYGEYSGGGFEGLAINEFLVKPFLGIPSVLPGILGNLGGIFGGGGSGMSGSGQVV